MARFFEFASTRGTDGFAKVFIDLDSIELFAVGRGVGESVITTRNGTICSVRCTVDDLKREIEREWGNS